MAIEAVLIIAVMLVTMAINGLVLNRVLRKIEQQCHDTQVLAATNRSLEYRVDRLAMAVDQSLQQLHRALEITSGVHLLIYNKLRDPLYALPHDDAGRISTYLLELKAIAVVNGDTEFIERVSRLREAVEGVLNPDEDEHPRRKPDVSESTEGVQRKVYDLLTSATRTRS